MMKFSKNHALRYPLEIYNSNLSILKFREDLPKGLDTRELFQFFFIFL